MRDLTGDGRADPVVLMGGKLRVVIGKKSRKAGPRVLRLRGAPSFPDARLLGDLDGDGRGELLVASGRGVIYGYKGFSTRALSRARPADRAARWAGDLNGDGRDDVLIPDRSGVLRILLSPAARAKKVGVDGVAVVLPAGFVNDHVTPAGDLNGDGFADLLTRRQALLGSASGALTLAERPGSPAAPLGGAIDPVSWPVPAGDVDGDGRLDLFAIEGCECEDDDPDNDQDPRVLIFPGGFGLGFSGPDAIPAAPSIAVVGTFGAYDPAEFAVPLGDVTGDHRADLALGGQTQPDSVGQFVGVASFVGQTPGSVPVTNLLRWRVEIDVRSRTQKEIDGKIVIGVGKPELEPAGDVDGDGTGDLIARMSANDELNSRKGSPAAWLVYGRANRGDLTLTGLRRRDGRLVARV